DIGLAVRRGSPSPAPQHPFGRGKAANPGKKSVTDQPPGEMVEWLTPAVPSPRPQTDEEKEVGKRSGRAPPTPEILQPTLDPTLPAYQPRRDRTLSGNFKGAASDVFPGLVNL